MRDGDADDDNCDHEVAGDFSDDDASRNCVPACTSRYEIKPKSIAVMPTLPWLPVI